LPSAIFFSAMSTPRASTVHAADVSVEEIRRVDALAPELGVEVHAAAR
jgi:hypothetical protein